MKPLLIETPKESKYLFEVIDYERPYFHNPVHFHAALELTLIIQGSGTRIVGDSIDCFEEGDLVLLGSNLPHQWKNEGSNPMESNQNCKAIVIHFKENCFGPDFFKCAETHKINLLLENAKRGLKVCGHTHGKIRRLMFLLLKQTGFKKVLTFLDILYILSSSTDLEPLTGISYKIAAKETEIKKLDEVYSHILKNLTERITLEDMAQKFNMSRTGFCRYFRIHTQKTFSRFVLEARIGLACKLLSQSRLNVAQVAYESGFNQLTHFNREFKSHKGITPFQYRKKMLQSINLKA